MRFAAAVPVAGSANDGGGNVISIHLCESGYFIPENTRSETLHVSARRGTLTSKKQHRAPAPHDATYHVRRQSHCARDRTARSTMLSQENNEILTRVGPGTPIGNLLGVSGSLGC